MGLFSNLFGSNYTETEIMQQCMKAVSFFQQRNFKSAVVSFEKYFEMKGNGKYPMLDKDDPRMLVNLGLSKQYSYDITGAIETYKKIIEVKPEFADVYMLISICFYKLNNINESKIYWKLAQKYNCKQTQGSFEEGIQRVNHEPPTN